MRKIAFYLPILWVFGATLVFANVHSNIYGRVEMGKLMDQNVEVTVKMDTGALTASLSAHDIKLFKKDGQEWVSFVIDDTHFKTAHQFEYPLKRMVRIKKRQAEMKAGVETYESRPVIEMDLCLGKEIKRIEVSLNDRSNFLYPMLLGRSGMEQFGILIDPSEMNTTKPICESKSTGTN
jgi:hypothetical protein